MSYNYNYMINLLPWWLSKNENVQAIYIECKAKLEVASEQTV